LAAPPLNTNPTLCRWAESVREKNKNKKANPNFTTQIPELKS